MTEPTCDEIIEMLAAHESGLLDDSQQRAVRAHVENCAKCEAELQALTRTSALLDDSEPLKPSRDLWPGIAGKLAPRRPSAAWWRVLVPSRRTWPAFAAAAAIILIVAASILYPFHPSEKPGFVPGLLAREQDEEAPLFVGWHAEASLASGVADQYALVFVAAANAARLEEAEGL